MPMLRRIIKLIIILTFPVNSLFAADIPIIVISPGKTPQSYDEVGSSVSVIDSGQIQSSSSYFISNIIFNSDDKYKKQNKIVSESETHKINNIIFTEKSS